MAKIRTLPKAVEEYRAKDPGSCITLNALRQRGKMGLVPSTRAGKNFLVKMDELEACVSGGGAARENQ